MLSLRLTQLTISSVIAAASLLLVFLTRTWSSLVGVAAATGLAAYAGCRTIDRLSLLHSDVIGTVTAQIFPFVRRNVKSFSHSVDSSVGYELEKELSELLHCIVRHCIESWYSHISECQSPVADARLLINNVTKRLLSRLASINRYRFLCRILCLYREHLDSCSYGEAKNCSVTSFAYNRNICTPKNIACPGNKQITDVCLSDSDTVQYLNTIVLMIANKLLDKHSANCVLGKEILSQIIVKEVILRILDIASKPEWLFNIVADILSDSSNDSFDTVADHACISAENNIEFKDGMTSCSNKLMDYSVLQATAIDSTYSAAASKNAISTEDASSDDDEQFLDSEDAVPLLCNYEQSLHTVHCNGLDMIEHRAKELSAVKTENITAEVSSHVASPHASSFGNSNRRDSRRPRSSSDCSPTFEGKILETSFIGNAHDQQLDSDTVISPELCNNSATSTNPLSSFLKKRASLVRILPSFKSKDDKNKAASHKSSHSDVSQLPRDVEIPVRDDSGARTSHLTAGSCIFSHKKTKSFSGSEDVMHLKPSISHSASTTALVPELGLDASAGFLSRHLSHLVRRFSSGLVRIPLFRSGSSNLLFTEADCASDIEFESITDLKASATEASEEFILDYQPDFLFKNICISVPERAIPDSKPYTAYVISVRNVLF